jgi:hypothetical protein
MWCFIDESWQENQSEHVGSLAAVIGGKADFDELASQLYRFRKKYYGEQNARDMRSELKGKDLFSNQSFKLVAKGYSKNLSLVRDVLEWLPKSKIRLVAICIYGKTRPPLLSPNIKSLSTPFRELCARVSVCVPTHTSCQLVFDQRLGAQEDISISVFNYLIGLQENQRLNPHPLVGVSNVFAGLQLADIAAHIIGNYSLGDRRFAFYYNKLKQVQAHGKDHHDKEIFGLLRLQWNGDDNFSMRKIRAKK